MKYDWEDQITPEILAQIDALLPPGISLIGVAVADQENAEGALIVNFAPDDNMCLLDVLQDVMGDAQKHYKATHEATFPHG